jgi:hypothetical protein
VTLTSKSVRDDPDYALKNVADLLSSSRFISWDEPDQWICWDFRGMRVRLTLYTTIADCLKSCVVDGSLDGASWVEIDRQSDNRNFEHHRTTASFPVSNRADFRFVRLTQTGQSHDGSSFLDMNGVEFYGTLFP